MQFEVFFDYQHRKLNLTVFCLAFIIGLCTVKYYFGHDMFVSAFYLLPIYIATWHISRVMGMIVGIFGAMMWLVVVSLMPNPDFSSHVLTWNLTVKVCFILSATLLLGFLKSKWEKESDSARKDHLTNIPNRRKFYEIVTMEMNRSQRYKRPFTVACMDIDGFKKINDHHGHEVGNDLLRLISLTMKRNLRVTDAVARMGGDEFAVFLPETDHAMAKDVLQGLQKKLLDKVTLEGFQVTFSMGAVTYHEVPASVEDVLKPADDLLYSAKNSGKNKVLYAFIENDKFAVPMKS